MICPRGHSIPDTNMICPTCVAESSEVAMATLQRMYLRKAVAGEPNYTLRVGKGTDRHVLQYTSFTRTFCGRELKSAPRISYEPYSPEALKKVCSECAAAVAHAISEATV